MSKLISNPELMAGKGGRLLAPLAEKFKVNPQDFNNLAATQRLAAGSRVDEAKGNEDAAQSLVQELNKHGVKIVLKPGQSAAKFFQEQGDHQIEAVAGLESTMDTWGKLAVQKPEEITKMMQADAIKEAKKVGMQTQTTADIIANAFSKWFNTIVSGIEFIVDHWPWSGGDKDKKEAQAYFDSVKDQFSKVGDELGKRIENSSDSLENAKASGNQDQVDAYTKQLRALEDQKGKLDAIVEQGKVMPGDQQNDLKSIMDAYSPRLRTHESMFGGAHPYSTLSTGASIPGVTGPSMMDTDSFIRGLQPANAPTGTGVPADAKSVTHNQTNYYSANYAFAQGNPNAVNKSNETVQTQPSQTK